MFYWNWLKEQCDIPGKKANSDAQQSLTVESNERVTCSWLCYRIYTIWQGYSKRIWTDLKVDENIWKPEIESINRPLKCK